MGRQMEGHWWNEDNIDNDDGNEEVNVEIKHGIATTHTHTHTFYTYLQ